MMTLSEGVVVDHYRIIRKMGSGGMADVYEAEESDPERRVALKVLPKWRAQSEEIVQRFRREARSAASMDHRGIVPIYKVGYDSTLDVHYISMRLLTGGDLTKRINAGMTAEEALMTVRELADAFQHAHSRGLIHRDVKPSNVLFDLQGYPVLTDFGIAKALNAEGLTAPGQTMGTPAYMSPEQWSGMPAEARSDLYSLGVMLFEMICGHAPFVADSWPALMVKALNAPRPPLPAQFSRLQPLVHSLMAKSPDDRPASAADLIDRINSLMGITGPITPLVRPRRLVDPDLRKDLQQRTSGKRPILEQDGSADPTPIANPLSGEQIERMAPPVAATPAGNTRSMPSASNKKKAALWASVVAGLLVVGGGSGWYFSRKPVEGPPTGSGTQISVDAPKTPQQILQEDFNRREKELRQEVVDAQAQADKLKRELAQANAAVEVKRVADAKADADAKAKRKRDAETQVRLEAERAAQLEADGVATHEADDNLKHSEELKAQREADENARRQAADIAERDNQAKAEKARREAAENDKREADALEAKRAAAEKARLEAAAAQAKLDKLEKEKRDLMNVGSF